MTNDCVAQSWFRFLHCLGNPVHLSKPAIVSQSQKFLHFTIINGNVVDPSQHPCLQTLPLIFSKAIKGISGQVDAFLGIFFIVNILLSSFRPQLSLSHKIFS